MAVVVGWLLVFGLPLAALWVLDVRGAKAWAIAAVPIVAVMVLFLWSARDRSRRRRPGP